jgi:hypothetical protein
MYLKTQYDMGLWLQVKIKFQTETVPIIEDYRNLIHKLADSIVGFLFQSE